jgi:hypothetical protein
MRHSLPGQLSTRFARISRHQSDLYHLVSPLPVMITATARFAEILLPEMAHFMYQCRVPFDIVTVHEVRVNADFMNDLFGFVFTPPAVRRKEAVCTTMS